MGAGPPVISPGVNLPGAEYFALAANRSIALGPRLATSLAQGPTTIPAASPTTATIALTLNPQWGPSQAIWMVRSYLLVAPGDSGGELQINAVRMGLGTTTPGGIGLDIGIPTATLAVPRTSLVVIYERDLLATSLDFTPIVSTGPVPLLLSFVLGIQNNDTTNPHNFTIEAHAVWHNVSGFVQ